MHDQQIISDAMILNTHLRIDNVLIIGEVYRKQGKYEEALEVYTKSLDIKTRIYGGDVTGDNHLDVAALYNNIGTVYESLGKYEEALEMHSKSLDIKTRILGGDNHPDVAASIKNIGIVYHNKGDRAAATEMYTGIPYIP